MKLKQVEIWDVEYGHIILSGENQKYSVRARNIKEAIANAEIIHEKEVKDYLVKEQKGFFMKRAEFSHYAFI